ncbi:MAG: amidohydrolase family protein, partial [Microbacterium sp.]
MPGATLLIRRARLRSGPVVDILCRDGVIARVDPGGIGDTRASEIIDAQGGLVIPGLTDHHLHLTAWAAGLESVDLSADGLAALDEAPPGRDGWVRAIGHPDTETANLDAAAIDRHRADIPVRVQQRSGGLWVLNSAALRRLGGRPDAQRMLEHDAA